MENEANGYLQPLGNVEHVKANLYVVKEPVITNVTYMVECPACGQQLTTTPEQKGIVKLRCDKCNAIIGFTAKDQEEDTDTSYIDLFKDSSRGMIEWGGRFNRKHKVLSQGKYIIGRFDKDNPSDIQINDGTMSRQSVAVEVEQNPGNDSFKLTVLRAKNPVKVGNIVLQVGNSLYLNFGDTILLGKTELKFKEYKKKNNK